LHLVEKFSGYVISNTIPFTLQLRTFHNFFHIYPLSIDLFMICRRWLCRDLERIDLCNCRTLGFEPNMTVVFQHPLGNVTRHRENHRI